MSAYVDGGCLEDMMGDSCSFDGQAGCSTAGQNMCENGGSTRAVDGVSWVGGPLNSASCAVHVVRVVECSVMSHGCNRAGVHRRGLVRLVHACSPGSRPGCVRLPTGDQS